VWQSRVHAHPGVRRREGAHRRGEEVRSLPQLAGEGKNRHAAPPERRGCCELRQDVDVVRRASHGKPSAVGGSSVDGPGGRVDRLRAKGPLHCVGGAEKWTCELADHGGGSRDDRPKLLARSCILGVGAHQPDTAYRVGDLRGDGEVSTAVGIGDLLVPEGVEDGRLGARVLPRIDGKLIRSTSMSAESGRGGPSYSASRSTDLEAAPVRPQQSLCVGRREPGLPHRPARDGGPGATSTRRTSAGARAVPHQRRDPPPRSPTARWTLAGTKRCGSAAYSFVTEAAS
jgi:hypothetical protein